MTSLDDWASIDTKNESTEFCAIPGGKGGRFKWPTLLELHKKLFNEEFSEAHMLLLMLRTSRCFLELVRVELFVQIKLS